MSDAYENLVAASKIKPTNDQERLQKRLAVQALKFLKAIEKEPLTVQREANT